jgi:hypothetical protein
MPILVTAAYSADAAAQRTTASGVVTPDFIL